MELTTEQLIKILLGIIVVVAVFFLLYNFSSNVNEFFKTGSDDGEKTPDGKEGKGVESTTISEGELSKTDVVYVSTLAVTGTAGCVAGAKIAGAFIFVPGAGWLVAVPAAATGCLLGGGAAVYISHKTQLSDGVKNVWKKITGVF